MRITTVLSSCIRMGQLCYKT